MIDQSLYQKTIVYQHFRLLLRPLTLSFVSSKLNPKKRIDTNQG